MNKVVTTSKRVRHFISDPLAMGAVIVLMVIFFGAIFAPLIAPQDPYDPTVHSLENSLRPPIWMEGGCAPFLLGADIQGRDILSAILYGSRTSLLVGSVVVVLSSVIGITFGLLCAFYGGLVDTVIMRLADVIFSFTTTLIALLILGVLKHTGVLTVILAILIPNWVRYARTMRASSLKIISEEYISAARASGASSLRIMLRHILPNAVSSLYVISAVDFGVVVMLEATLSFLGIGVPITEPSLGSLVSEGKDYLYLGRWWLLVFPGAVLASMVVAINLIADWMRVEFNPRLQGRRKV